MLWVRTSPNSRLTSLESEMFLPRIVSHPNTPTFKDKRRVVISFLFALHRLIRGSTKMGARK